MRKTIAILCLVLAACADLRRDSLPAEEALLRQAIAAAGGEEALSRAQVLKWTGEATVFVADERIEIGVDSRVDPFLRSRSDTWLLVQGDASKRGLEIDGERGWILSDGQRTPMDQSMLRHERMQYATYGLMRLVTLREPGVFTRRLPPDAQGRRGLHVEHPLAAPADLYFDADGRLAVLTDIVPSADGGPPIAQRFEFNGVIEGGGVRWPRNLLILQNERPYFELRLTTFAPGSR